MRLPFLSSFFIFILWLTYELHKYNRISQKPLEDFWKREHQADKTPAKSLENLTYISIPWDMLPTNICLDNPVVQDCLDTLHSLSDRTIVNLTGLSNTDLKLEYGASNLHRLTDFDQNYTILARTLQKWANELMASGYIQEAVSVAEFAISTQTDITATYKLLLEYYSSHNNLQGIQNLKATASQLKSLQKDSILSLLSNRTLSH